MAEGTLSLAYKAFIRRTAKQPTCYNNNRERRNRHKTLEVKLELQGELEMFPVTNFSKKEFEGKCFVCLRAPIGGNNMQQGFNIQQL